MSEDSLTASPTRLRRLLPLVVLLATGCAYFNTFYNARNYYRDGLKLKEQQQVSQAKARFEKSIEKSALVISRWPQSRWVDDATFLIGRSYYEMGQYGKALRHFERLALAFPNSPLVPEARLFRGMSLLRDGQFGDARVVLGDVQQSHPRLRDEAAYELAVSFYRREEYGRAADSLAAFIERFPRSDRVADAVERLAESCYRLERWEEAGASYDRLVRLLRDPKKRAEARLRAAACRLELGDPTEAVRQAQDVLGRYAELDDEANVLLGRAQAELGKPNEALAAWSRVRGNSDIGAEAFYRIGKFHEEQKSFELAQAHYDTARSRRANSDFGVLAVKRLALLDALAQGDSTERAPAEALFLLAEVHNLNLAEYDEAVRYYRAVHDSFPGSEWAPKALLAVAWIERHVRGDSAATNRVLNEVIAGYRDTEYGDEARRWLGEKVPERRKPGPPKPDTLAPRPSPPEPPRPDTIAGFAPEPHEEPKPLPGPKPEPPVRPSPQPEPKPPAAPPDTGIGRLEPVRFGFDRWDIAGDERAALDAAAKAIKESGDLVVAIVGHTDPVGTEEYNRELGRKRAEAVRDRLVSAGVDPGRLRVESRGESETVSRSPDEYWRDRRVEYLVR
ncbi:tetratricopeptide repeat protein [candidate division WOR-3 bacterium]|nr:tetratricopeptide repeat protein [candidate division WOR-3 bacterium]